MSFEITPDYKQINDGSRVNDSRNAVSFSEAFAGFSSDFTHQASNAEASFFNSKSAFAPQAQVEQGKDGSGYIQLLGQKDNLFGSKLEAPKQSDVAQAENDRSEKNHEATREGLDVKDAIARLPEKPPGGWSFSGGTFDDFLNSKLG